MVFVKYDRDLKVIAVKMSRRGMSLAEINAAIEKVISAHSLSRWNRLYEQTRDVVRDPAFYLPRGRPLAFTTEQREFVLAALEAEPTLYVDEIQSHIQAMTGVRHPLRTILDELKIRLQLTKKVARTVHPAQCGLRRAMYIDEVGLYPSEYFVFLDECAVSQATHSRDRAWARRGRRTARLPRPMRNTGRISVLPAVSLDGTLTVVAQPGSILRIDLEYFLEEGLMPLMNSFPGPNSILIMDNAPIHHGGRIEEICAAAGVLLIYLPPYSPDMNPIEKFFSVLKSQLKRRQILTGGRDDPRLIKRLVYELGTPELMRRLFLGSGYSA